MPETEMVKGWSCSRCPWTGKEVYIHRGSAECGGCGHWTAHEDMIPRVEEKEAGMSLGGTPDVKYTLDEVSDDIMELTIHWKKHVRQRKALGKLGPETKTRVEWLQLFVDYIKSREMIE